MNPMKEIASIVGPPGSDSSMEMSRLLTESGLDDKELEATIGALNFAFRKHVQGKAESTGLAQCSFCHRSQKDVKSLVVATDAAICDQCIDIARDTLKDPANKKRTWFGRDK